MALIIASVQSKGGVGKSTSACNIAGAASTLHNVALLDCDLDTKNATSWNSARKAKGNSGIKNFLVEPGQDLLEVLDNASSLFDVIVVDVRATDSPHARSALLAADLAVVPVAADKVDTWGSESFVELLKEANAVKLKALGKPLDMRVLWTKYQAHIKTSKDAVREFRKDFSLPEFKTMMPLTRAFTDAYVKGQTVIEYKPNRRAREPMIGFMRELERILKVPLWKED
jgi:chromosome partitioning protein